MIRLERPDFPIRAGIDMARWGATAAGGYKSAAMRFPREPAVVDDAGALTFRELQLRSNALADALSRRGIGAGTPVALLCRNHRGFVESVAALSKLGAQSVLLNTAFSGPQCAEAIARENAVALIRDAEFAGVDAHLSSDVLRIAPDELAGSGRDARRRPPERRGRTIILTSGTTGAPKGAARPEPGDQGSAADTLATLLDRIPLRVRDRVMIAAPLFHTWGYGHLALAQPLAATVVLRNRFDPEDTLATLARERCRTLVAVPVMLQRILELPESVRRRYDLSALEIVASSGSALPGELAARFMDAFGDVLHNLYGSTEVAWAAIGTPEDLRAAPGTAGRAPRGTTLKILGPDGREVPQGETGRIFVANDLLFEGYTGGGSKEVVHGLMSTGDLGHLDSEGRLFVEGRADDMIVSGGENVFPQEVEELLARHPAIREAAAIGVPDERFGERLKAFVVADGDGDGALGEDEVKRYVKENLASFKVPREVAFVDELPRNAAGKVVKRLLA